MTIIVIHYYISVLRAVNKKSYFAFKLPLLICINEKITCLHL